MKILWGIRTQLFHILFLLGFLIIVMANSPLTTHSQVVAVDSFGITVSDMDRSLDFYTGVLGFVKVSEVELKGPEYEKLFGVPGLRVRIAKLRMRDEYVDLIEFIGSSNGRPVPIDSKSNDLWFQHIAMIVSDMDRGYEKLQENNVRLISTGPQILPESNEAAGGIRAIKFLDPDGHPLELLWFPPDKGDPRWQADSDNLFLGIDHTAIGISDTKASTDFYAGLLGLAVAWNAFFSGQEQNRMDGLSGATVNITGLAPVQKIPGMEFLEYKTPRGGRPAPPDSSANDLWHWQTRMVVDDLEPLSSMLKKDEVSFISPEVVVLPDDQIGFKKGVMVLDPDGHPVLLIEK